MLQQAKFPEFEQEENQILALCERVKAKNPEIPNLYSIAERVFRSYDDFYRNRRWSRRAPQSLDGGRRSLTNELFGHSDERPGGTGFPPGRSCVDFQRTPLLFIDP